jgi:membrane fusion protein, multidrug efflux system
MARSFMRGRKLVVVLVEIVVLFGAAALLHHVWKTHPPLPTQAAGDADEDDLKYNPIVPVHVAPIVRTTLHGYVDAYGTVEPEPARNGQAAAVVNLSAPLIGSVSVVNCIEGEQVKKGQVVFSIEARAAVSGEPRAPGAVVLDQAKPIDVKSPIDGTVTLMNVHAGEVATPWATAVQVVDLNRLVIAASVPASQLQQVRIGQVAEVDVSKNGTTTMPTRLPSEVVFIDPQVEAKSGLGSVDVKLPEGSNLRLGDSATVHIVVAEHQDCLAVPPVSIAKDSNGAAGISIVKRDSGMAVRQQVKIGLREEDLVEISGLALQPGMLVVTTGADALPDRSQIEIKK